jgi:hypothetical protein|tara:strand:+ start:2259 stop:3419 length:1161 start_codon:yes stop_codon:yes gene_type:complete
LPDIWLPYGSVEVAVRLKAENLAEEINKQASPMSADVMQETLGKIDWEGRTSIFSPKPSNSILEIIRRVIGEITVQGIDPANIIVYTDEGNISKLKKSLGNKQANISGIEKPTKRIGKIDGVEVKIPKILHEAKSRVIITDVGLDPLFGFSGGPASLVRYFGGDAITEAFRRRKNNYPSPGEESGPSLFANEFADFLSESISIEVLPAKDGVSGIHCGNLVDAHKSASKQLIDTSRVSVKRDIRALIVSTAGYESDSTLADGLKAVWNVVGGMNDKGHLALIAECSDGLGSEALKMYVSGRLDVKNMLKRGEYIEGLEDLVYLQTALHRSTLILVSALPDYYTEVKMGFQTCRKAGDALSYILSTAGVRTKVHILHNGTATLLSKK